MIVLNFHRIEGPTGLEINRVSPKRFGQLLDILEESGISVASPGRDPLKIMPEVLLTFDDGFESIARNALPQLVERGWGAVIFLISGSIGGEDNWDTRILGRSRPIMGSQQIREWSEAGFVFGSHTRSHRDLTALTTSRLDSELRESKCGIEDITGRAVSLLSYPFGRHNERVRDAARRAGYDAAFAVSGAAGDRYAIPRINVHALMTTGELQGILTDDPKPSWRTRLFSSLSAGSATVGNWKNNQPEPEISVRTRPVAP